MKPLARDAAIQAGKKMRAEKQEVQDGQAKYWGCLSVMTGRKFTRSDGTIGVDKTKGFHARPRAKQTARNANRAIRKRGRQALKKAMMQEL